MSTQNPKKERRPLPPEPPEVIAKRDKLLAELEVQSKTATGTFQQVVRTMKTLVTSTQPGSPFDEALYGDVSGALNRFMKDPILPVPPVLGMVVDYLQTRLSTYGVTVQNAVKEMNPELHAKMAYTPPAASSAAAAPAAAPASAGAPKVKDGFEGASKARLALNPEASVPAPADPKQEQQNLESFKAWMKNPSLGKLKG
ncbi:hypothetical protein [Myxococcus sp. RHSTA-1-4]|uniref:hypothetical protein n=1 Tax=Myxococcus sp. RHSTA-1-4 TaxID=2874601 RepID=UPI001CBE5599|nr:hypothetical protein [Myxococcus sp. RHSTA-1-4]MBZ4417166.1 hypothetical protein [Myxococcus sp. RHSTA-1-4]